MSPHRRHAPASTRHAFALAFDLAFRRDPLHSIVLPLVLRSPWLVSLGLLQGQVEADPSAALFALLSVATIGDYLLVLAITAMMRFRARSVFNTPSPVRPAPVLACYSEGLRRVPWLVLTEALRNVALAVTALMVLPGLYLAFKLAFATEAVVLDSRGTVGAFQRSFSLTEGRFERWLEMMAASVVLVLGAFFGITVLYLLAPGLGASTWAIIGYVLVTALATPLVQYAWTFFYLRLVEVELPAFEAGPTWAAIEVPGRPGTATLARPADGGPAGQTLEAARHGDANGHST
jgi:hypothetical protein